MYVAVIHRITDAVVWDRQIQVFETTELPAGMQNPISYVGTNKDYAFCLWDVPSIQALQPLLDEATAGAAVNTYFPVDPAAPGTAGIPVQRLDLTAPVGVTAST